MSLNVTYLRFDDKRNTSAWESNLVSLTSHQGIQYWMGEAILLREGFRVEGGVFRLRLGGLEEAFAPPKDVVVGSDLLSLSGVPPEGVRFTPQNSLPPSNAALHAQGNIRVQLHLPSGVNQTFQGTAVDFANYPEKCYVGSYPTNPFRWYKSDGLDVVRSDDKSDLEVKINRLSEVKVVDGYAARKLVVKSNLGSEIEVTHRWDNLKSPGPAEWEHGGEGIVLSQDKGRYVFIPFKAVRKIEFGWP
jgi:hypothetical protein